MPAFSWNTQGIEPKWGSPGGGLPVGKHPVIIYNTKLEQTSKGTGGKMVLQCEVIDGPMKGVKGDINLTLQHENPVTVRISGEQLTAICYCVGLPGGFQSTEELHNKPFVVETQPQKEKPQYTEVIAVFDINGNEPRDAGNGGGNNAGNNNQNQNGANNGGGNGGGGWGSGGAANQGGGNADQGANQQQGGNGGGWQQGGGGAAASGGSGGWGAR